MKKVLMCNMILNIIIILITWILCFIDVNPSYSYENDEIVSGSWLNYYDTYCYLFCIIMGIMLVVSWTCVYRQKSVNPFKKLGKFIVAAGMFVCSLMIVGLSYLNVCDLPKDTAPEYFEFTDGNHTIVICEEAYFRTGSGTVYQVWEDGQANVIGTFATDECYRNHGQYHIEWDMDGAEIYYRWRRVPDSPEISIYVDFIEDKK